MPFRLGMKPDRYLRTHDTNDGMKRTAIVNAAKMEKVSPMPKAVVYL